MAKFVLPHAEGKAAQTYLKIAIGIKFITVKQLLLKHFSSPRGAANIAAMSSKCHFFA